MNRKLAALAIFAAAVWWLMKKQTTAGTGSTTRRGGVPVDESKVRAMAEAIARAEGFNVQGSVAQRTNNPGNLRTNTTEGRITGYPTAEDGWRALENQIRMMFDGRSSIYHPDMTFADVGDKYEADPGNAWARNVVQYLGVTLGTTLREWAQA